MKRALRWLTLLYLIASLITFATYALDKAAARQGGARVPERTLHLLELAGGWPGALLGQQLLRHKTRKVSYQLVFWLMVGANVTLLLAVSVVRRRRS